MIANLFVELGPWSWIILGLVLLVLEIVAPGTLFLWFGLSALVVGLLAFAIDMGWQAEFILFAILSLISVIAGRMILSRTADTSSDKPLLNERAKALVGETYILDEPITNGKGRVKVNDSYWRVEGPDCEAGSKVQVTAGEGTSLVVQPC